MSLNILLALLLVEPDPQPVGSCAGGASMNKLTKISWAFLMQPWVQMDQTVSTYLYFTCKTSTFVDQPRLTDQAPLDMEDWLGELLHFSGGKRAADIPQPEEPCPKALKFLGKCYSSIERDLQFLYHRQFCKLSL